MEIIVTPGGNVSQGLVNGAADDITHSPGPGLAAKSVKFSIGELLGSLILMEYAAWSGVAQTLLERCSRHHITYSLDLATRPSL